MFPDQMPELAMWHLPGTAPPDTGVQRARDASWSETGPEEHRAADAGMQKARGIFTTRSTVPGTTESGRDVENLFRRRRARLGHVNAGNVENLLALPLVEDI